MSMLVVLCAAMGALDTGQLKVTITCETPTVPMGDTAVVRALVTGPEGRPFAGGAQLLPYVDGRRWGHHATSDASGRATFRLPMPRPGKHDLRLVCRNPRAVTPASWMWPSATQGVPGPAWFQKTLTLPAAVGRAAVWAAADDEVRLFINGVEVVHKTGWNDNVATPLPEGLLKAGDNILSAWANNGGGPAGVLLRLEMETPDGPRLAVSDGTWKTFTQAPVGWPVAKANGGETPGLFGRAGENVVVPRPWPGLEDTDPLYADPVAVLGPDTPASNTVEIQVENRALVRPPKDPGHLVGVQWEPWFTPRNAWWSTAQGVPLLGFYNSLNRDITRQHVIWFIESGVDFIVADWSNHIWFKKSWKDIGAGSWELIDATTAALDELAAMRDEGLDVPKFTLLTGISHVPPPDGPRCVNEQLAWIHDHYVANPKYAGLWQTFEGKPLIMPLNLGASYLKNHYKLDERFCIRFMGAGTDHNEEAQLGLWSWMDHEYPGTPMKNGMVESMTASVGSFEGMGWLGARTRGRRNGATLVEDWNYVMQRQPKMVQLHQFNEFTGAREGQAHGPGKDQFYDSYSIALSDDFEPVTLDQAAYRGEDGYGFYYLNLVRALVALYREHPVKSTVLAIQQPTPKRPGFTLKPVLTGNRLELVWTWAGKRPDLFSVTINDRVVLDHYPNFRADIDLAAFGPGELRIRVTGDGSRTRYPLAWDHAVRPLEEPVEAFAEVVCLLKR